MIVWSVGIVGLRVFSNKLWLDDNPFKTTIILVNSAFLVSCLLTGGLSLDLHSIHIFVRITVFYLT